MPVLAVDKVETATDGVESVAGAASEEDDAPLDDNIDDENEDSEVNEVDDADEDDDGESPPAAAARASIGELADGNAESGSEMP